MDILDIQQRYSILKHGMTITNRNFIYAAHPSFTKEWLDKIGATRLWIREQLKQQ